MSDETPTRTQLNLPVLAWVLVPALLLLGVVLFIMLGGPSKPAGSTSSSNDPQNKENFLHQIRTTLGRQTDLAICRTVVQQLNMLILQDQPRDLPALQPQDGERLTGLLRLNKEELAEVGSPAYTPLDAHHLEACFLLRDAARSLELASQSGDGAAVRQTPLDRALAAFDFAVREVRLPSPDTQILTDDPAPPAAVLRRGTGTPLERALVFLALLEQFGIEEDDSVGLQGALLFVPGEKGSSRLWACGVVVGNTPDAIHLFDPAMGLPLPGPGGKGVATLEQARRDPSVLGQLRFDKLPYDVTQEQARAAKPELVCPISSAAPRMMYLQDRLLRDRKWKDQALPSQVRVRLAESADRALASMKMASEKSGGKAEDVGFWAPGAGVLRRFLPREEGGANLVVPIQMNRLIGFTSENDQRSLRLPRDKLFQLELVPWTDYPPLFRDPEAFPFTSPLGLQLRTVFQTPFMRPFLEGGGPRDLMLRGKFSRAVPELVSEQQRWQAMNRRVEESRDRVDLLPGVRAWVNKAIAAYAYQLTSKGTPEEASANQQVAGLWNWQPNDPIEVVMLGAMAPPMAAESMYQLALCRHEQAVRLQQRLDLAKRAGLKLAADEANARKTWNDAEGFWKEFLDMKPERPGFAPARRLRGEALLHLGQPAEAARLVADLSSPMTDREKIASLWLAKQYGAK